MVRFSIPIQLPSLANERMGVGKMIKTKKYQKAMTAVCMNALDLPALPLTVTITRIGPQRLDDDNLQSACKYVRDAIAAKVGVDDGSPLYTWLYCQRTVPPGYYNVEVEITTR